MTAKKTIEELLKDKPISQGAFGGVIAIGIPADLLEKAKKENLVEYINGDGWYYNTLFIMLTETPVTISRH